MATSIKACVLILSLGYRLLKFMDRLATGDDNTTYTTAGGIKMNGSVQLDYGGTKELTIVPVIEVPSADKPTGTTTKISSITSGDHMQIPKSKTKYSFKVGDSVVATIWNHDDESYVEIKGGKYVAGTGPFTVTTNLVIA